MSIGSFLGCFFSDRHYTKKGGQCSFYLKPLENKGFSNKKGVSNLTLPYSLWEFLV